MQIQQTPKRQIKSASFLFIITNYAILTRFVKQFCNNKRQISFPNIVYKKLQIIEKAF